MFKNHNFFHKNGSLVPIGEDPNKVIVTVSIKSKVEIFWQEESLQNIAIGWQNLNLLILFPKDPLTPQHQATK